MAKKSKINILVDNELQPIDGYVVNDDLGLALVDGLWIAIHLRTGCRLIGKLAIFKQKRQCLAYVEHLASASIDWQFDNEDEMFGKNDKQMLNEIYLEAVEKGKMV